MRKKTRRFWGYVALLLVVASGCFVLLHAFQENVVFFLTPTELQEKSQLVRHKKVRLGGLVRPGSVHKLEDGLTRRFIVHDHTKAYSVQFRGIPPALFREGKGIIAEGYVGEEGLFQASELLAKHDENYMPPAIEKKMATSTTDTA